MQWICILSTWLSRNSVSHNFLSFGMYRLVWAVRDVCNRFGRHKKQPRCSSSYKIFFSFSNSWAMFSSITEDASLSCRSPPHHNWRPATSSSSSLQVSPFAPVPPPFLMCLSFRAVCPSDFRLQHQTPKKQPFTHRLNSSLNCIRSNLGTKSYTWNTHTYTYMYCVSVHACVPVRVFCFSDWTLNHNQLLAMIPEEEELKDGLSD